MIYQPLHVVLHHGDYHEHNTKGELTLSHSQEKCLAYEYQFASFDLPNEIGFESLNLAANTILISIYDSIEYTFEVNNSSPRAPPVSLIL
jgi:hypothetical protein